ncbi:polysaccharide pyruvyl transferase family protein [Bacillus cereus]
MKKIVISGWYGEQNLGDEVILEAMLQSIGENIEDLDFSVLSFNPEYTKANQKVHAVKHFPYTIKSLIGRIGKGKILSILEAYKVVKDADVILIGGGGFLSDWNPEAIKPWIRQIYFYKKILNKKIMLYAIGAGPFIHDKYMKQVKEALDLVDVITVRDQESYDQLKKCGVTKHSITSDPVVSYKRNSKKSDVSNTTAHKIKVGVSIAPLFMSRLWKNHEEKYRSYLDAYVEFFSLVNNNQDLREQIEFIFIPMQDDYDIPFNKEIISRINYQDNIKIIEGKDNEEKIDILQQMDLMIGMRLHSIIIASTFGVPSLGVVYHHKVNEYLKRINMSDMAVHVGDGDNWIDTDLDANKMFDNFIAILQNKEHFDKKVVNAVNILRECNLENVEHVQTLLEKGV